MRRMVELDPRISFSFVLASSLSLSSARSDSLASWAMRASRSLCVSHPLNVRISSVDNSNFLMATSF